MTPAQLNGTAGWLGERLDHHHSGATMNSPEDRTKSILSLPIGAAIEGGFLAGFYELDDGALRALIVAPKADGEHKPAVWIPRYKDVPGAKSWNNGLANTDAMADAGSKVAQWARGLRIGGFDDWHLPAQDQLEIAYRAFKPTGDHNSLYARSGINLSAIEPTRPYTLALPALTAIEAFRDGGAQAFETEGYWTSTQHAAYSDYAWYQGFDDGSQSDNGTTSTKLRARAVRSVTI